MQALGGCISEVCLISGINFIYALHGRVDARTILCISALWMLRLLQCPKKAMSYHTTRTLLCYITPGSSLSRIEIGFPNVYVLIRVFNSIPDLMVDT